MSHKVHVVVPHTVEVACGAAGYTAIAAYREMVTCKQCRKTDLFKQLPNLPPRFRKSKKDRKK